MAPLLLGTALLLSAVPTADAGDRWMQNDGWEDGGMAGFQGGFIAGECWGSVYVPDSGERPFTVEKVRMLVGGSTSMEIFSIHFYELSGSSFATGTEYLGGEGVAITGSNEAWNEVAVAELEIGTVTIDEGNLGVSVCLEKHSGYPAIARDTDGMAYASRNWIYADGFGWVQSNIFGVSGDWIMRPCILGDGVTDDGEDCSGGGGGGDDGGIDSGGDGGDDGGTDSGGDGGDGGVDSGGDGGDGGVDSGGDGGGDDGGDTGPDDTQGIELSSITPGSMVEGEAVDLALIGSGFGPEAEARIGGVNLVGLTVVNTETITGRSPTSLPVGVHDVEVVDDDGSSVLPGAFEVLSAEEEIKDEGGCSCATGGAAPRGVLLGAFVGLVGLVGFRRR